ncbi:MAG: D-alanyl-D-alanine carboxypeptidase family protein [Bacillaceae bacterium]
MRKRVIVIAITLFCLIVLQGNVVHAFSFKDVGARNAVLMEQSTGRVLYSKLPHSPELIASITKIMTATLAIESGKLEETTTVSHTALQTEGSSIYLKEGQKIKLKDLVYGLMLRSGNDAANVIAEHVGGSIEGFVFMMNKKAEEIGMEHTVFSNPSGLEQAGKDHYSSAYDMALLTRYAMNNKTYQKIASTKKYQPSSREEDWGYMWNNKNKLLTKLYSYSTGGKTGFTKKAGRTLVSTAKKDGMDLIVVTLNDGNDWNDHMYLFNTAFANYKVERVLSKGLVKEAKLKKGGYGYIKTDFTYPLTKKEKKQVTMKVSYFPKMKDNQKVGVVTFYLKNEKIGQRNLFYSKSKLKIKATYFMKDVEQVFLRMIGVGEND